NGARAQTRAGAPWRIRDSNDYFFFVAFAAFATLIALTPSWSPLSLSWQVRVTFWSAFRVLSVPMALSSTGTVMLEPVSSLNVICLPSTSTDTTVPFRLWVLPAADAGLKRPDTDRATNAASANTTSFFIE